MSQQGVMIDSFRHSAPRYAQTAKGHIDPLETDIHMSLSSVAYPIKREITSDNTPAFGGEVTFKFPSSGYVHSVAIRVVLAQTTTENYSDYPGAVIVDTVELRADNEQLHQYKYDTVFPYYVSKLKDEDARDKLLLTCGGTNTGTSADITVMIPIPTFFDHICVPNARPLNLAKFDKQPDLKLTMRSLANSVKPTSTGGSITSMTMVLYMSDAHPEVKGRHLRKLNDFHHTVDFYTNSLNSVATSTATYIDVSGCKGLIKKFMTFTRTVTDVDTSKQYYSFNEIDEIKTRLDGHEEYVFKTKEEGELDFINYNHGEGFNSTVGYYYWIPYHYAYSGGYGIMNTGGVHSAKVNKHELKITHSIGANEYIDVLGIRSVVYKYDSGTMIKLL